MVAINELVARGLVELLRGSEGLVYRTISSADDSGIEGTEDIATLLENDDERIVYQCIRTAGNKGIWTRDLKQRTSLHQTVISKTLRQLESRKLVKSVKSVKNPTRKVYMLAHLQPDAELTGGPWFSQESNELDTVFIDELCRLLFRFVLARSKVSSSDTMSSVDEALYPADYSGFATVEQVYRFVKESRISSVPLTIQDIAMLLARLEYDGMVEKVCNMAPSLAPSRIVADDDEDGSDTEDVDLYNGMYVFKAISPNGSSRLADLPCGQCPVMKDCSVDGVGPISPGKCEYFGTWLAF